MAAACVHVINFPRPECEQHTPIMFGLFNVGYGEDVSILELAQTVGYTSQIHADRSKPGGTPRKLMDSSRLKSLGWQVQIELEDRLKAAYEDFSTNYASQD